MQSGFRVIVINAIFLLISLFLFNIPSEAQTQKTKLLSKSEVSAVMKKASDFMMSEVSNNGGFLWKYSEDLSKQWGEIPARKSQVMVQEPGTVGVGELFLDIYKNTGDKYYLDYAKKVANAIVYGQYSYGGWHYFIDFDMPGIRKFYDNVASKCWGWEEYYHFYGNCTFDDDVTAGATRFLLDLYMTSFDPAYKVPLTKALDFILVSQYPNGGWPQRYPLSKEFSKEGHPDYTSFCTYNDEVIHGNIFLLLEAYDKLGDEIYLKAAVRGMDFYILSQLPPPQAGWGQQYDLNMRSVAARTYEPASVMPGQTVSCIRDLMDFYGITGDRRYLRGIPDAIGWLEDSIINMDTSKGYTHATFYELGTNKPLFNHRRGTTMENGGYFADYNLTDLINHYGQIHRIDIEKLKKDYTWISALNPEEAISDYAAKSTGTANPKAVNIETVRKLIDSLDKRGAWVTDVNIPSYSDPVRGKAETIRGIETRVFINNIRILMNFLGQDD